MRLWDRLAGGLMPVLRWYPRAVFTHDGAEYGSALIWLRRSWKLTYTTPRTPRSVRRMRKANRRRNEEQARRRLAGEPAVQVGDILPPWATAFLEQCQTVRDNQHTLWKRAVADERYDSFGSPQEHGWVRWGPGEWGGGWRADDAVMLDEGSPLTVIQLVDRHDAA